jgi:hypothetical protein
MFSRVEGVVVAAVQVGDMTIQVAVEVWPVRIRGHPYKQAQ